MPQCFKTTRLDDLVTHVASKKANNKDRAKFLNNNRENILFIIINNRVLVWVFGSQFCRVCLQMWLSSTWLLEVLVVAVDFS